MFGLGTSFLFGGHLLLGFFGGNCSLALILSLSLALTFSLPPTFSFAFTLLAFLALCTLLVIMELLECKLLATSQYLQVQSMARFVNFVS